MSRISPCRLTSIGLRESSAGKYFFPPTEKMDGGPSTRHPGLAILGTLPECWRRDRERIWPTRHRQYEIRCPIHGFVAMNDWERDRSQGFQRLRRIRQLAGTDLVYPGAMHTRFEHSLGVMHVATQLYDAIVKRSGELLRSELAYNDEGLQRDRVRPCRHLARRGAFAFLARCRRALPGQSGGQNYEHEDYSAAVITEKLRDSIEKHPLNQNLGLRAEDVPRCCREVRQPAAVCFGGS